MRQWAASSLREWTSNRTRWNRRSWAVGRCLGSWRKQDCVNSCWQKRDIHDLRSISGNLGVLFFNWVLQRCTFRIWTNSPRAFGNSPRVCRWVQTQYFRTDCPFLSLLQSKFGIWTLTHPHERVFQRLACIHYGLLRHSSISIGLNLQNCHLGVADRLQHSRTQTNGKLSNLLLSPLEHRFRRRKCLWSNHLHSLEMRQETGNEGKWGEITENLLQIWKYSSGVKTLQMFCDKRSKNIHPFS